MQGHLRLPSGFSTPDPIWLVNNQPPISSRKLVDVTGLSHSPPTVYSTAYYLRIAICTTTQDTNTHPTQPIQPPTHNQPPTQTILKMSGLTSTSTQSIPSPTLLRNPTNTTSSQRLLPNQQPRLLKQTSRRRRRAQSQALLRVQRRESRPRRVHAVFHGQRPPGCVRGYGDQVPGLYEGLWV
jgi:hypothetical protein